MGRSKRRLVLLGIAIAALTAASGVSYAAGTGTTGPSIATPGDGARVTVLHGALPGGVASLPHDGRRPALTRAAGEVGDVGRAGDVFLVDTTGLALAAHASLYITNLPEVAASMRSFALPVGLWSARGTKWRRDDEQRYLTRSTGRVELTLSPGRVYTVSLERGGSWVGAPAAPQLYLAVD
jgi:hypothetical protein